MCVIHQITDNERDERLEKQPISPYHHCSYHDGPVMTAVVNASPLVCSRHNQEALRECGR